jgi:hypothetical protein
MLNLPHIERNWWWLHTSNILNIQEIYLCTLRRINFRTVLILVVIVYMGRCKSNYNTTLKLHVTCLNSNSKCCRWVDCIQIRTEYSRYEKLEDIKVVIRSRTSKNRQYNGQEKKDNRSNNYLQNTTSKTTDTWNTERKTIKYELM